MHRNRQEDRKTGDVVVKRTVAHSDIHITTMERELPFPLRMNDRTISLRAINLETLWNLKPSWFQSTRITFENAPKIKEPLLRELRLFWEKEPPSDWSSGDFETKFVLNELGARFYGADSKPDIEQFLVKHRGAVHANKFSV